MFKGNSNNSNGSLYHVIAYWLSFLSLSVLVASYEALCLILRNFNRCWLNNCNCHSAEEHCDMHR